MNNNWQKIALETYAMNVPGGVLVRTETYQVSEALVFVPNAQVVKADELHDDDLAHLEPFDSYPWFATTTVDGTMTISSGSSTTLTPPPTS